MDWFNVYPVACRSLHLRLLELNAYEQDQLSLLNSSQEKGSIQPSVSGHIHTRRVD